MQKKEDILEKSEVVEEKKEVIDESTPTEAEEYLKLTPIEAEEYFKGKVVWHLFRIIFDLNNDGGLREYIQTAESVIISNINDICSGNYEFALDENLYLWSDTWELREILVMIAIYCKELTLKEWQGEKPIKKLRTFFNDIINYFDGLKDLGLRMGEAITKNENEIYVIETECDKYIYRRLWPFIHHLYYPPLNDKISFYTIEID